MTWVFNNVTITTGGRYIVTSNNESLSISGVTPSDSGVYICRAENIAGVTESSVNVTILGMLP